MCRESQMAVAAAQRALHDSGNPAAHHPPERFGCVFGTDYMLTLPEDFTAGVAAYLGFVRNDNPIFLGAFFAAMAAGFGAQIWFILGLAKAGRGG